MNKHFSLLLILVFFASCSPYQKALKSEDVAVKYPMAEKLYEEKKYTKAIRLFEQIAPSYRGKPQAEKMFYMYAQSYYKSKQYYLAGYQFESFVSAYPKSEKVEEAAYLSAFCYSKLSPRYSLDQVDTYKALEKMQRFIDTYPNSEYLEAANVTVKMLREKLEEKAFEIAKQYNTIRDYKAALVVLDNFVSEHPGTPFKEDAYFYKLDSAYKLATNSIEEKKRERFQIAKEAHDKLIRDFPETKYKSKVDQMKKEIDNELIENQNTK
ncbi:MAG: outer membrane protein assembly factor BamD [Flavobacterium sp.]